MTQARSVSLQPTSVAYWVYCLSVVWVAGRHDAGPQRESTADFCVVYCLCLIEVRVLLYIVIMVSSFADGCSQQKP